ncbi:MAG: tRNA (N6-isopentenyl adenosine(37)-C2)-methylthiotransferase MiaB [Clostridia bacterium]|nr:tRNA (N6-isopentenyl adenosine(37)-C2)-methylthiotransferase MiaB [Clostridia bacterium]
MNVHESEKIAGILSKMGYTACDKAEDADVIVFNTCCVRENAEQHAFGNIGMLKKLKSEKRDLVIVVCGCMTQQADFAQKLFSSFPYVDIIIGTYNVDRFGEILSDRLETKKRLVEILDKNGEIVENITPLRSSYPNAWVNISYGCDNYCTYCIVPYVRGRERSRSPERILTEIRSLVDNGYKEITLLGQNVNSYGKDLSADVDFVRLLDDIAAIDGKFRLRFMSNHPKDMSIEVARAIKRNPHACHSIHLPVQSGSDRILKLMNRHYDRKTYEEKISFIREEMSDCAITTDIIVGFPTETDADFNETLSLCEEINFFGAFTFVYSPRRNTPAAAMDGQVSEEIKKERIMRLVEFQNAKNREQSNTYIGKTVEILVEDYDKKKNLYLGRDEYGKMAYFSYPKNITGQFAEVQIDSTGGMSLFGNVVKTELQ